MVKKKDLSVKFQPNRRMSTNLMINVCWNFMMLLSILKLLCHVSCVRLFKN